MALESDNHILLEDEPAWPASCGRWPTSWAPTYAPGPTTARHDDPRAVLSPRELEVLALAAEGQDNATIAGELTLSVRTVERHLQNVYDKLGLRGKSARAGAVSRLLGAR